MNPGNIFGSVALLLLGALSFGTITSFPSLAISSLQEKYPEIGDQKYEKLITWFLNGPRLSAALGSFLIIPFVFRFGRKKLLLISSLSCGILWFLLYLIKLDDSKNNVHFNIKNGLIIRTILGIFWGIVSNLTIIYIIEIVPSDTVGLGGSLYQLFIIIGICLNNLLAAFYNWEMLVIVGGLINILLSLGLFVISDSPVSLMIKSMRNMNENNYINRKQSKKKRCGFCTCNNCIYRFKMKNSYLLNPKNFKNIISSIAIFVFQQYSGINAILNNLSFIMKKSGLDLHANIQSFMSTLAQFLACTLACFLMDHLGPRILWLASCIGCFISLVIYSYCIFNDETKSEVPLFLPVLSAFSYCLFFGLGLGPTPWIVFPIEFPDIVRYECMCWMMFSHYLISFVVCYTHPIIEKKIGEFYAILIYIVGLIGSFIYGFICLPHNIDENQEDVTLL